MPRGRVFWTSRHKMMNSVVKGHARKHRSTTGREGHRKMECESLGSAHSLAALLIVLVRRGGLVWRCLNRAMGKGRSAQGAAHAVFIALFNTMKRYWKSSRGQRRPAGWRVVEETFSCFAYRNAAIKHPIIGKTCYRRNKLIHLSNYCCQNVLNNRKYSLCRKLWECSIIIY